MIVRVQKECHAYTENTLEAISKIPSLILGVGEGAWFSTYNFFHTYSKVQYFCDIKQLTLKAIQYKNDINFDLISFKTNPTFSINKKPPKKTSIYFKKKAC